MLNYVLPNLRSLSNCESQNFQFNKRRANFGLKIWMRRFIQYNGKTLNLMSKETKIIENIHCENNLCRTKLKIMKPYHEAESL